MSGRIANRPKFREMLDAAKGPTPPFQEILGGANIHYIIPTPPDSPIGGLDVAEFSPRNPVLPTVHAGGDGGTRTHVTVAACRVRAPRAP